MLQNEDIKKIDELKTDFTPRWFEVENIFKLIDLFNFSSLLKSFSVFKKQGFSFKYVLSILLLLPFLGIANVNNISIGNLACFIECLQSDLDRLKKVSRIQKL